MKKYNIFLGINIKKDKKLIISKKVIDCLKKYNVSIYVESNIAKHFKNEDLVLLNDSNITAIDYCLVLGGDGTFIAYSNLLKNYNIPMLGVNLGRIGYLTDLSINNLKNGIDKLLSNQYQIINRSMLEVNNKTAINEIYIYRGSSLKMLKISLRINKKLFEPFYADGIIISTPTGSSAYNYSAGGTILPLDSHKFCITPICPNQKHFMPILINDTELIEITILPNGSRIKPLLVFDGNNCMKLNYMETLKIQKSTKHTKTIKLN